MRKLVVVALSITFIGACAGKTDPSSVSITLTDFDISAPVTATTGPTLLRVRNQGDSMHELRAFELTGGKGLEEARAHFEDGADSPAPWMRQVADLSVINPGIQAGIVANLSVPGTYLLACLFPDTGFTSHAALGMLATLEVGEGSGRVAPEPQTTIRITDDRPSLPTLTEGKRLIAFDNTTAVIADAAILDARGAGIDDLDGWIGSGQRGEPPLTIFGGAAVPPGQIRIIEVTLPPGEYRLLTTLRHSEDDLEDRFTPFSVI